jgi:long-chain acyl-CoA synthetase
MTVELNTLSYILLTTIFSAASMVAMKHGRFPDVHPIVINSQAEFAPLRYAGESTTIKPKLFPNGAPILTTVDQPITTLSELYQYVLSKYHYTTNQFLGARDPLQKGKIDWVKSFMYSYLHISTHIKPMYSNLLASI